jgi:hypothetical protein
LYSFTNQYIYNKKEIMKKIVRLTERDLSRIVKRVILEMEGEDMMDGEMEEGMFSWMKRNMGDVDDFKQSLMVKLRNYEYLTGRELSPSDKRDLKEKLTAEAEADGYAGELKFMGSKGDRELVYINARDAKSGGASVTSIAR